MAVPPIHIEDDPIQTFDEEYKASHPASATLEPGALEAYQSEAPSPAPLDEDEEEGNQGPIDITKWHGPSTHEEVAKLKVLRAQKGDQLVRSCASMIECLGEDLNREGLVKTPLRMAKALQYFTSGYETSLTGMH
jgi:hypothetical protein